MRIFWRVCCSKPARLQGFFFLGSDFWCIERPPVILLQFTGKAAVANLFLKMMTGGKMKLVQIDTAVFSYEPVLQRLQEMKEIELTDELFCWEENDPIIRPREPPTKVIQSIEFAGPGRDLQAILGTVGGKVELDSAQTASLLMGLNQRVSLIQGPPGEWNAHPCLPRVSQS